MMEQALWFDGGGTRLFGVYHAAAVQGAPHAAFLVVHSLFEEKKSAHRILVDTARTMAAAGFAVLRFDLAGCGDSQGTITNQSMAVWQDHMASALRFLAQRIPDGIPLGILGIRMGATLALAAANVIPDLRLLVLWEPVPDGAAWLRERLRQRLVREMLAEGRAAGASSRGSSNDEDGESLDVDGFRLSAPLVRDLKQTGLSNAQCEKFNGAALLLQIAAGSKPSAALESLRVRWDRIGRPMEVRCLRAPPFWNRLDPHPCPEAAVITLDWLNSVLPVTAAGSGTKPYPDVIPAETKGMSASESDGCADEHPMTFGDQGSRLRGIFHAPRRNPDPATDVPAVLFLHGWGAYRIGPHRMFVHAARFFAEQGMPVLRFDFSGRGDSQGATEQATIDSMSVDAGSALNALRAEAPGHPLIVLGMCSGAKVAAALAAGRGGEIDGVIFWSPEPPDEAEQSGSAVKAVRRRGDVAGDYLRKLLRPAVWRKALAGRVNWRLVRRALLGRRGPATTERERDRAVYQAFAAYSGRRLLVYGRADPMAGTARAQHRKLAQTANARFKEYGIEDADHNFYHADWERAVIETTAQWLKQ